MEAAPFFFSVRGVSLLRDSRRCNPDYIDRSPLRLVQILYYLATLFYLPNMHSRESGNGNGKALWFFVVVVLLPPVQVGMNEGRQRRFVFFVRSRSFSFCEIRGSACVFICNSDRSIYPLASCCDCNYYLTVVFYLTHAFRVG